MLLKRTQFYVAWFPPLHVQGQSIFETSHMSKLYVPPMFHMGK
jgi:hypothetical protein